MNPPVPTSHIWDLLGLASGALFFGVSLLLWFLKDYLDLLKSAEEKPADERLALSKSARVTIIAIGVLFITLADGIAVYVAAAHLDEIALQGGHIELVLLFLSLLFPILGAFLAAIVLTQTVGARNILASFANQFRVAADLSANQTLIPGPYLDKPTSPPVTIPLEVLRDWETQFRWVEQRSQAWGMGMAVLENTKNRALLRTLMDRSWAELRAAGGNAVDLPARIEPVIHRLLKDRKFDLACIQNRPLSIAQGAAYLYFLEINR